VIDHDWNKPCPHGLVGEAAMWCLDCESDAAKAPAPAPASPPVGEPAPAEHGMEEIERLVNTLAACSRAVGLAIGAGTHADIDERREAVARTALLDTIRAALTAAASAATKGDAT
jgi:hypothetical protein